MNVKQALESRYSVRAFKSRPVDRETLVKVLEPALRAPSWANTQPWVLFVAGGDVLERLRQAYLTRLNQGVPANHDLARPQQWPAAAKARMAENTAARARELGQDPGDQATRQAQMARNFAFFDAPAVVYLTLDRTLTPYSYFDVGMLAQSIMLEAEELGLGSIPAVQLVAYPDLLRAELGIPDDLLILLGVALGYPEAESEHNKFRSSRRPLQDLVRFKGL
jgi:nitroreductase